MNYKYLLLGLLLLFNAVQSIAEQNLPNTLTKIKGSIVAVGTFKKTRTPPAVFLGTGFVVGDGSLVITNSHVLVSELAVAYKEQIAVFIRKDGKNQMFFAEKLAEDQPHDIAVLKMSSGRLPALSLGNTDDVREGQLYAFTGYPIGMVLGLYPVTHQGIVSAITPMVIPQINSKQLNARLMKRLRDPYNVFQLDATAYPGNSGSPLYNIDNGAVIGVINKVFVKESKETVLSKPSGITYAIPIDYVKNLLRKQGL